MVISDCNHGQSRPAQIILACGDGAAIARHLGWSTWGAADAEGAGVLSQDNCTPDCADGHFIDYTASFRLSEPVPVGGRKYFTRVTITYKGISPFGKPVEIRKDCADTPEAGVPQCPGDLQNAP